MNLPLKSNDLLKFIALLAMSLLISVVIFWSLIGTVWTWADFQLLDFLYKRVVKIGYTPEPSSQIIYLLLNDETYSYFGTHVLDRADLANVNTVLLELGPEAVAYDMIFARPSNPVSDRRFAETIKAFGCIYLPIAFELSEQGRHFTCEEGEACRRLKEDYLKQPIERGNPKPVYAVRSLMQLDDFSEVAHNSGHANASLDPDGVYRHHPMLIHINSQYFPTLSLAMFLDYVGVSLDEVLVDWEREIRIPAKKSSYLDEDIVIPIDNHGRTFIPFTHVWSQDFKSMFVHNLLEYANDPGLQGNVTEFFEGRFVFIGDISQGFGDSGQTSLEDNVPLIAIHTALLNGLLNNRFYQKWSFGHVILLICVIAIVLTFSGLPTPSWVLYATGSAILIGLIGLTWLQFLRCILFPFVTVGGSVLVIFGGLAIGLQVAIAKQKAKQQAYIRDAFTRYVPVKVVEELIAHPERLTLGGEERVITVLFSDLQNFTAISEQLSPRQMVQLLNEYLSEMTAIIISEGGIIDKYLGDAIMAEFGVPLPIDNHADLAVSAALKMQRRLHELRQQWAEQGVPALQCRIGINTGPLIIGNMGSDRVFDYTVIGDGANLASRLENVNKLYNTFLMISEFTHQTLTPDRFRTRILDVIKVKGRTEIVKVFEVYGEASDPIGLHDAKYYQSYQTAFDAYLSRDFVNAHKQFTYALQLRPRDPAATWMLRRIDALDPDKLPEDWNGSVKLDAK